MCFLSDFSIDELLSQTLKVEALDQPVFFFSFFQNFLHKCLMFRCNQSNHPCFLLATPYAHRQGSKILCLGKILICQKSIVLDFDILIVRQELPDVTRHVTRRRARPPMPPFQKLGHCTNMLHSNLHHMTTLFPISINDYNKTGYESFSDVGEIRVYFASKILTPCRMH